MLRYLLIPKHHKNHRRGCQNLSDDKKMIINANDDEHLI